MSALEETLAEINRWALDPVAFFREVLGFEPDLWQKKAASYLVQHEPHDGCDGSPGQRCALRACKGPGKSRFKAAIGLWFLTTRPHANILAISITGDNLKTGLWKELALLISQSPLLTEAFEVTSSSIYCRGYAETWWIQARSFPQGATKEQQAATIAGLHAEHVMVLIDEAGDVPVGVLVAAEGIFANKVEAYLVLGGNTTSRKGALYDASVRRAHRFHVYSITGDPDDPERSPRINIDEARAMIADLGRDHPYVMVNYLGQFPETSADHLLGDLDIMTARKRSAQPRDVEQEPVIVGFDIARHGDDQSTWTKRQGIAVFPTKTWRIADEMLLADQAARMIQLDKPDAVIIGVTGMGWGVYDRLKQLGYDDILIPIDEASAPMHGMFLNRRAEMWWNCAQHVRKYASLPNDPELHSDMLAMGYEVKASGRQTKIQLWPSEQIKKELGRSPDKGTSLALTYAAPVAPRGIRQAMHARHQQQKPVDPWAAMRGGS